MAFVLQAGIQVNSPVKFKGTSKDIPLTDEEAATIKAAIAIIDSKDANPGSGDIEIGEAVKFKVFGINVKEEGWAFFHLKEVA